MKQNRGTKLRKCLASTTIKLKPSLAKVQAEKTRHPKWKCTWILKHKHIINKFAKSLCHQEYGWFQSVEEEQDQERDARYCLKCDMIRVSLLNYIIGI